jgi:hypothetical protein
LCENLAAEIHDDHAHSQLLGEVDIVALNIDDVSSKAVQAGDNQGADLGMIPHEGQHGTAAGALDQEPSAGLGFVRKLADEDGLIEENVAVEPLVLSEDGLFLDWTWVETRT